MGPLKSSHITWVAMALLVAAGTVVLFSFDPAQHAFYPGCALYRITGLYCPAAVVCGRCINCCTAEFLPPFISIRSSWRHSLSGSGLSRALFCVTPRGNRFFRRLKAPGYGPAQPS